MADFLLYFESYWEIRPRKYHREVSLRPIFFHAFLDTQNIYINTDCNLDNTNSNNI